MSFGHKSTESSFSIKSLEFPDLNTSFIVTRSQCSFRCDPEKRLRHLTSADLGKPPILSIRKTVQKSSTMSSSIPTKTTTVISKPCATSRYLTDTLHKKSMGAKRLEYRPPCAGSDVLGAPRPYIGSCALRATTILPNKKKFSLTEDPRKRFCLRNPETLKFKTISKQREQANITELVKTADNLATSSGSQSADISSICEVVDLANPLNLDFQGMDYKKTYNRDEQSCKNQIEYRKVRRFKHRRNVKVETVTNTEKEQQEERIAVPKHFIIKKSSPTGGQAEVTSVFNKIDESYAYGRLIRAEQKPKVKSRLEKEEKNRRERYKQLYLSKKAKAVKREDQEKTNKIAAAATEAKVLAEKDIKDLVELLDRTVNTKKREPRIVPKRRDFPHTLSECLKFRHTLKKSNRVLRDRAMVKQEFYEQKGKRSLLPEAKLVISSDSYSRSPRDEQLSTNDEDDMVVGQRGSKFFLRGFLYKLSGNLRGKFHQKDLQAKKPQAKGCMTRSEWFETLVSKKKLVEQRELAVDIFSEARHMKKIIAASPIHAFRRKPLGRHYDRVMRRNLRLKKPKRRRVKKFNLIGYLYGVGASKDGFKSGSSIHTQAGQTLEYIRSKAKIERLKKRVQKRQRMHYMGIPYIEKQGKPLNSICVDSASTDSGWVPNQNEQNVPNERVEFRSRSNMPAPEYRETTLLRHPRLPRDYNVLRVPSDLLDEYVKTSNLPFLKKLPDDKYFLENVRVVKDTEYGRKFEVRHHHHHLIPNQHKTVQVLYSRKIPKLDPVVAEIEKTKKHVRTFDKARPRDKNVEELDFTLPIRDTDKLIEQFQNRPDTVAKSKARLEETPIPHAVDKEFHSIADGELQEFPGRDKFLEFLSDIRAELHKRAGIIEKTLTIDKKTYINELEEDLRSIESCMSSLSSSECTNLSNESGSFLMAGNQKIPLDYIRKPLVPFEETNRSRFQAVPIHPAKEELDPWRCVPFCGQQKEQMSISAPKDSFFTFNTRLQNGLRLRLEVKQEDPRKKLLGAQGRTKAPAQVATDIDELYVDDLRKRPGFKLYKWQSGRTMIKDALRKKFESMLIQGEIVRAKIYDRRNEFYFKQMIQMKLLIERLFAKWEKKEYEAAMEVVHKVKPYYEATDKYRREAYELGKQYTVLNMEIVYIENDWMRRTILQNFHYLLADMEWRAEHDWIHRDSNGDLEGFEESIAKRSTTNIRKRDKDDAWAIKEFYENHYLQNYHPIIVVFRDAKEFINGIENLKSKTFVVLLELHYTMWILAELDQKYQEFSEWCVVELESKKAYAESKCANKYFMEDRAKRLKAEVQVFLNKPIKSAFGDKRVSHMKGVCNEVYKDVVPASSQMDTTPLEQVATISQTLTDLLGKFEKVPVEQRRRVEKKYRRLLAYRQSMSRQTVLVERRIASEMVKVRRNLAPPFQKPKPEGKLPRSELRKVVKITTPKPVVISEKTKFFYKAFHEEGDLEGLKEARESLDVMDDIQESIVPFYFDHFLSINGYQPNYNFKTQIELRDGPEVERFQVKAAIPEVLEKFEKWQAAKKRTMDEHINRNPKMYQNVQI